MAFGGLDIGTSGCKCTLFNDKGKQLAASYRAYETTRSQGHHEIDVFVIWAAVKTVLAEAAAKAGEPAEAICVSSFGESCAFLDKNDKSVIPTILYDDPRGNLEAELLSQKLGGRNIFCISGHRPGAMYTLPKMMWAKQHLPDSLVKLDKVLPIASFVIYCLTGERVSDPSLASRTMILDIEHLNWNPELLSEAGIKEQVMPRIGEIGEIAGTVKKSVAEELRIPYSTKIIIGAHDQIVAAIGAGVLSPGLAVNGSGSVESINPIFTKVSKPAILYKNNYAKVPMLKDRYVTYAFIFTGGVLLQWFRDNFAAEQKQLAESQGQSIFTYLDAVGKQGPTGILALPHFSGAATPYMDANAKGALIGLTLEHGVGDIYKALQEGICYESALNMELLAQSGIKINSLRIVGGGAKSRRWNQMKSDIYGIPCTTLHGEEAGAIGSAMLAGVAINKFDSLEQSVTELIKEDETYLPRKEYTEQYALYFERYKKIYKAIKKI
jgi:xylulokinase